MSWALGGPELAGRSPSRSIRSCRRRSASVVMVWSPPGTVLLPSHPGNIHCTCVFTLRLANRCVWVAPYPAIMRERNGIPKIVRDQVVVLHGPDDATLAG